MTGSKIYGIILSHEWLVLRSWRDHNKKQSREYRRLMKETRKTVRFRLKRELANVEY